MIKALVCIPSFGLECYKPSLERALPTREYLLRVLKEYEEIEKSGEFKFDIHLYLTDELDCPYNLNITKHMYDKDVHFVLTRFHRALMEELRGQYDLYMYFEDDILVTLNNLRYFMRNIMKMKNKGLDFKFVPGFFQYENPENKVVEKYIMAQHHGISFQGRNREDPKFLEFYKDSEYLFLSLVDEEYFQLECPHNGGFIITREQFDWILDNRNHQFHVVDFQGIPESSCNDIYLSCGLRRLTSRFDWEDALVYHQGNWHWTIGWLPYLGIKDILDIANRLYEKHGYPAGEHDYWR